MISPFDIPLITDVIAKYLSKKDCFNCILVSRIFYYHFKPRLWSCIVISPNSIPAGFRHIRLPLTPNGQKALIQNGHLVRSLCLRDVNPTVLLASVTTAPSPLKNLLDINFTSVDTKFLVDIWEQNPHVQKCKILEAHSEYDAGILTRLCRVLSTSFYLSELQLLDRRSVPKSIYLGLLQHLPTSLQSLVLNWSIADTFGSTPFPEPGWRYTYFRLKKIYVGLPLSGHEETTLFPFLERCPALESFGIYDGTRSGSTSKIAQLLGQDQLFPKLRKIRLKLDIIEESEWMQLMMSMQGQIKSITMNVRQFLPMASGIFTAMSTHWGETLRKIHIKNDSCVSSSAIELLLTTCLNLKKFHIVTSLGRRIPGTDIPAGIPTKSTDDFNIETDSWKCLGLESLEIAFADAHPINAESLIIGEDSRRIRRVYWQLGRLTKLKYLRVAWDSRRTFETYHGVDFSIKSGLNLMEGLKDLQLLDISCVRLINIGHDEVDWVLKNWPKLKEIRGLLPRRVAKKGKPRREP
ncbi:hypothetical protein BGZ49_009599, partial [Haplosporangium sp. Z 27]